LINLLNPSEYVTPLSLYPRVSGGFLFLCCGGGRAGETTAREVLELEGFVVLELEDFFFGLDFIFGEVNLRLLLGLGGAVLNLFALKGSSRRPGLLCEQRPFRACCIVEKNANENFQSEIGKVGWDSFVLLDLMVVRRWSEVI